ncbi:hypothetical protein LA6_003749 [Marinibacterium anthonyi]|nr:hypothetical protein LA6_003749 [Marinibacterium anthonyi]
MKRLQYQICSNVIRDSLSVELIDADGDILAEISHLDGLNQLKINTFDNDIDLAVLEEFILNARENLECFEDGSPLSEARTTQFIAHR